jgi:four helix bundle protein
MPKYKTLDVWHSSKTIVQQVYQLTQCFPVEEKYVMVAQIKRAAISVAANLAEGFGRKYKSESVNFFFISRGSLYEVDALLDLAEVNGFLPTDALDSTRKVIEKCLILLNGLIRYYTDANLRSAK